MKNLFVLILIFLTFGCQKTTIPADNFDPNLVKAFDGWKTSQTCKTAKIDEYTFKAAKVYVFDPGLCGADMFSPIYDAKGQVFCNLGGIIGNVKCDNVNFSDNSKFVRNIWKKN